MYHDLGIDGPSATSTQVRECLAQLIALGYSTVALCRNPAVEGRLGDADRPALVIHPDTVLSAAGPQHLGEVTLRKWDCLATSATTTLAREQLGPLPVQPARRPALRQLSRLNFIAGDPVQCEALSTATAITSGYDLVSVQPTNERTLQQACASMDIDIISLKVCEKMPFKLRPATLRPALVRGVMFEVCYAPALHNAATRTSFAINVQALARCTRGRNIILSSGTNSAEDIRSPHAASSLLASVLAIPTSTACDALTLNAAAAVAAGATRRVRAAMGPPGRALLHGAGGTDVRVEAGKKVQASVGRRRGQAVSKVPVVVLETLDEGGLGLQGTGGGKAGVGGGEKGAVGVQIGDGGEDLGGKGVGAMEVDVSGSDADAGTRKRGRGQARTKG